jgi:hypothetical protein
MCWRGQFVILTPYTSRRSEDDIEEDDEHDHDDYGLIGNVKDRNVVIIVCLLHKIQIFRCRSLISYLFPFFFIEVEWHLVILVNV